MGKPEGASYNGSVIDFVMHFTNQTQASVINELKERVRGNIREIPAAQKTQNVEKGEPGKVRTPGILLQYAPGIMRISLNQEV